MILSVNRKFEETGSAEDALRCGRPVGVLTEEKLEGLKKVEKEVSKCRQQEVVLNTEYHEQAICVPRRTYT